MRERHHCSEASGRTHSAYHTGATDMIDFGSAAEARTSTNIRARR